MQPIKSIQCIWCKAAFIVPHKSHKLLCPVCNMTKYSRQTKGQEVAKYLGQLAQDSKHFAVMIRDCGIYKPIYDWNPTHLYSGDIIGSITLLGSTGIPSLSLARVMTITYKSEEGRAVGWPHTIIAQPILHANDSRGITDLAISKMTLTISGVYCKFEQVIK